MSAGQIVTLRYGLNAGKRAEVIAVNGNRVTVRGRFGAIEVLASEVKA